jgi:hypothetical protein
MHAIPVAVLLLASASGCLFTSSGTNDPLACTELYTEGGLAITVTAPPATTPSRYRIEVEAAGEILAIEYDLAANQAFECVQPCGTIGDQFVLDQGLGGGLQSSAMIAFITDSSRTKGPVTATLRVSRAGTLVHQQLAAPVYRTTEPNGRGCGQVSNADISIALP